MANTQTATFIAQYEDEVKVAFQQKQSLLMNSVFKRSVEGSTVKFPYLGAVATTTKARNGDVVPVEPLHSNVTATMEDFYCPIYWDELDEAKTNQDLRKAYIDSTVAAVNRKIDSLIITAMLAGTATIPTATGAFTKARYLEAVEIFNANEVDAEDRFLLISPAMLTKIYGIEEFNNHDYQSLSPASDGKIGMLYGTKVIVSNLLPTQTAVMWNKRSVGLGVNKEFRTEVNYIPEKVSTLFNTFGSAGSVIIDPVGVVEIAIS